MIRQCNIFKTRNLIKAFAFLMVGFVFSANSAFAFSRDYSEYCGFLAENREQTAAKKNFDTDETKKKVENVNKVEGKTKDFCKKFESYLKNLKEEEREFGGTKDFDDEIYRQQGVFKTVEIEDTEAYNARFDKMVANSPTLKKEYESLQAEYKDANDELQSARKEQEEIHNKAVAAGEYQPCGQKYPRGCPNGQSCYEKQEKSYTAAPLTSGAGSHAEYHKTFECLDPNSKDAKKTKKYTAVAPGENTSETHQYVSTQPIAPVRSIKTTISETGDRKVEVDGLDQPCTSKGLRETYQKNCYSCIIVKTLIETFLTACAATYDITSEAGVKILTLGSLIWVAFFVLKNISSLVNVEPGAIMNSLTVFFFKVMVAYLLITSGLGVIVKYAVNPFLTAGADFGLALMSTTSDFSGTVDSRYVLKVATVEAEDKKSSTEIVSKDVMNKIMLFTQNLDKTVSTNLVIGHAITCYSLNAGAWNLKLFKIVNLFLWIKGAFIWFIGFMLTLSICYYLLDISFKLGFAIMAFPVVLGLWPFNITKGKVTAVFSIILKSGATFAFLAMTTTYALLMIDQALRGIPNLLEKIENNEALWIADTFDLTGSFFLIIVFAFIYSTKLIGSTITDYVDKIFSDGVFGSASPMHNKTTQMTDFVKQHAMGALKSTKQKAAEAIKEEALSKMKAAAKFAKGLASGSANGDTNGEDGGAAGKAGGAVKGAGAATQQAGKAVEGAGEGVNQAGKGVEQAGKLTSKGGDGLMKGGAKLTGGTFGIGAIVGVPMMIAGAAMKAGGKTAEVAGKGAQKVGKAMKKSGKQMQKVGKKIEEAGKKIEKVGKDLQFGKGNTGKEDKNKTENKEDKPSSAANSGGDSQQDEQIPSQQEPAADGGNQQQPATQAPDDNDENQNNK